MDVSRLLVAGRALRLYQQLGLQTLLRRSGLPRLLPRRLRDLEAMTPDIPPDCSADLIPPVTAPRGPRRFRVAVLTGCAQDLLFSDINRDTVEVLAENGCEVVTPPAQHCCGSLHAHNGELGLAAELARRNLDQFPPGDFDAIISNAGGCGLHLKHYGRLLADDARYRDRARQWDRKVRDVHEWLVEIGVRPPRAPAGAAPGAPRIVTYHESCHLSHGQRVVNQPRQILRLIPNLQLVELPEAGWCCGSAGIYNLTQPEMARALLERKLAHLRSTGAQIVANGNAGCLLQLILGVRQAGLPVRVAHPVSLLAEAYRAEKT
jgi:glycolate oxidase iron-sulfur subunit